MLHKNTLLLTAKAIYVHIIIISYNLSSWHNKKKLDLGLQLSRVTPQLQLHVWLGFSSLSQILPRV